MSLKDYKADKSWTLFLDRDGVINRRIPGDYVKNPEAFEFLPGVKEAFKNFAGIFGKIIVVTNQQGIGKGLMTITELEHIHDKLKTEVNQANGRIDKIYFCPDLKESYSFYRKPNIGMALKARRDFPEIRFRKSVMAGDNNSDMQFGKRSGMCTVLISSDLNIARQNANCIDYCFPDLLSLSQYLLTINR